mmetsp:Transcript_17727/g.32008  ORF Transcript_17727/g.32008 Transcript_17727/m.32008 type:complete len:305 (-) Transcript_17727:1170-2084(-)
MAFLAKMSAPKFRFFDVAANLSDKSFFGKYNSKNHHGPDVDVVIQRAKNWGVQKFLLAGGNLKQSKKALEVSLTDASCYCTVGVHPCLANTVDSDDYFDQLRAVIREAGPKCIAIGECGLDYDRLHFSTKEHQHRAFSPHFALASETGLPMYLHSRNTGGDFVATVSAHRSSFSGGLVHSFTGDVAELQQLLDLDLYIGVNGCSLKLQENLDVVRAIPLDKIMIETDCPYCEIRPSHAAFSFVKTHFPSKKKERHDPTVMVKGRNEPCTIVQVLEAVAAVKGVSEDELAEVAYLNACKLFNLPE